MSAEQQKPQEMTIAQLVQHLQKYDQSTAILFLPRDADNYTPSMQAVQFTERLGVQGSGPVLIVGLA